MFSLDQVRKYPIQILLIEDSESDAGLIKGIFQQLGPERFQVQHFDNISKVDPRTLGPKPDIALLDLSLPDSQGLESIQAFKKLKLDIPFIVMTGKDNKAAIRGAVQQGAQDYFEKAEITSLPLEHLITFAIARHDFAQKEKELADHILQQERRLKLILNGVSDGILAVDDNGKVQYANPAACELMGKTAEEIYQEIFIIPPIERESIEISFKDSRAPGHRRYAELRLNRTIWEGKGMNLIVLRDVTDRHLFQERFLKAQRQEAVDQLAAAIAHEFNNALAIIRMTAELLLFKKTTDEERQSHLNAMLGEVKRSLELVRKLMNLSRQQGIRIEPLNLRELFSENRVLFSKTLGENIQLSFTCEKVDPIIDGDRNLIEQATINLLINARHAMPHGGKMAMRTFPYYDAEREGHYICFEFKDTGTGMSEETKARIFEPFFSTKAAGEGTGLGLPTVLNIMEKMNGWIDVETKLGHGSTFRLYFPASEKKPLHSKDSFSLKNNTISARILVVDDEVLIRSLLTTSLSEQGHRVFTAASGDEALSILSEQRGEIDLVITDMVMPQMSGIELIEKIREMNVPCRYIVMSAYSKELEELETKPDLKLPFTSLDKPFDLNQLNESIQKELLNSYQSSSSS